MILVGRRKSSVDIASVESLLELDKKTLCVDLTHGRTKAQMVASYKGMRQGGDFLSEESSPRFSR